MKQWFTAEHGITWTEHDWTKFFPQTSSILVVLLLTSAAWRQETAGEELKSVQKKLEDCSPHQTWIPISVARWSAPRSSNSQDDWNLHVIVIWNFPHSHCLQSPAVTVQGAFGHERCSCEERGDGTEIIKCSWMLRIIIWIFLEKIGEIHGRGTDLAAPGGAARRLGDGGGGLETKAPRRGDSFLVLVWFGIGN